MNGLREDDRPLESRPTAVAIASVPARRISWGAVLVGTVVSLVSFMTLALLGMAIGMAAYDPATEGDTAQGLAAGAMIWWIISAFIALFLGGWAAGRLAGVPRRVDAVLHGIAAWGVTTLVLVFFMTTAVGTLIGGALSVVSNSVEVTGDQIAEFLPDEITTRSESSRSSLGVDRTVADRTTEHRAMMDHDANADAGMHGSMPGRVGSADAGLYGRVTARSDTMGMTGGADIRAGTGVRDIYDHDRMAMRDREIAAERDDHKLTDTATTTDIKTENAAEAAAVAAGWSFFMLLLGASAAAMGGAVAGKRNRLEAAVIDEPIVTRTETRIP